MRQYHEMLTKSVLVGGHLVVCEDGGLDSVGTGRSSSCFVIQFYIHHIKVTNDTVTVRVVETSKLVYEKLNLHK